MGISSSLHPFNLEPCPELSLLLALLRDATGRKRWPRPEKAAQRDQPVHMIEVNYAEAQYTIRRKDADLAWQTIAGELVTGEPEFTPLEKQSKSRG